MIFLNKHSARDKRLLALERELHRLWQAQLHAPVIPLERPYQRGWLKFYVLADRIDRRPDAAMFRAMLAQVNHCVYSRERSFINRAGHPMPLRPRVIPAREWLKLAWPMSHQRFFGYGHWRLDDQPWTSVRWRQHIMGFKLFHTWWLREEVQPHLVTHQRVEIPQVRARIAEIDAELAATCGRERLGRLHGRSRHWRNYASSSHELRTNISTSEQLAPSLSDT